MKLNKEVLMQGRFYVRKILSKEKLQENLSPRKYLKTLKKGYV
ncbi:hypothetical protein [Helicobacter bilis]|nr:hypothetical protein [Helicobacter bilis]